MFLGAILPYIHLAPCQHIIISYTLGSALILASSLVSKMIFHPLSSGPLRIKWHAYSPHWLVLKLYWRGGRALFLPQQSPQVFDRVILWPKPSNWPGGWEGRWQRSQRERMSCRGKASALNSSMKGVCVCVCVCFSSSFYIVILLQLSQFSLHFSSPFPQSILTLLSMTMGHSYMFFD